MKLIFLFICIKIIAFSFEGWIHLELGAGNYGEFGGKNKKESCDPSVQYAVLFWTLDELVSRFGEKGTIVINDSKSADADYAAKKLEEYILHQEYHEITVMTVPGDYRETDFSFLLTKFQQNYYDSIHLKNPEGILYGKRYRKEIFDKNRQKTRDMLQNLANLCQEGLYLFILDTPYFLPEKEKKEFIDKEVFYKKTTKWPPVNYYFP